MSVVFMGVLLCSFGLQKLLSPAGDAVLRAVDSRPITLTGTIHAQSPDGGLVLENGCTTYVLTDPATVRPYAGHKVRVVGTLHEASGLLDIRSIISPLDAAPAAQ